MLTVFMEQKTGPFSYLPYKSGGEAATQLVGGHTESNVNNPSENWKSGAPARCGALRVRQGAHFLQDQGHGDAVRNDIPICKEDSLDVQYLTLRAMFLPGRSRPTSRHSMSTCSRR